MMTLIYVEGGAEKRITGIRTVVFAHLHNPNVEGIIAYGAQVYMLPLSAVQAIKTEAPADDATEYIVWQKPKASTEWGQGDRVHHIKREADREAESFRQMGREAVVLPKGESPK